MWALLHAAGLVPPARDPTNPVPPLGVPLIGSLCFWGCLYDLALGLALPRLPRAPMWLLGLGLGLLAAVVGWYVVAPLKGQPVAGGFVPLRMLVSVLIKVLLHLCAPSLTGYSSEHGETAAGGFGKAGSKFQGSAVHGRGDPLGGPVVSDVPDQLPRPRTHAGRPRR